MHYVTAYVSVIYLHITLLLRLILPIIKGVLNIFDTFITQKKLIARVFIAHKALFSP